MRDYRIALVGGAVGALALDNLNVSYAGMCQRVNLWRRPSDKRCKPRRGDLASPKVLPRTGRYFL